MQGDGQLSVEYIDARRVLLDALAAIEAHIDAITLIGAQAVYLRTIGRLATYQPYTTDADLVVDPSMLVEEPPLGEAMRRSGFDLTNEPGIWHARFEREGLDDEVVIPVDVIVPEGIAASAGRRCARLPGGHGKNTARKSPGVEGALVDRTPLRVDALDPSDKRSVVVNVAGEAALLLAKLHKLGDRLDQPHRLQPKDAGGTSTACSTQSVQPRWPKDCESSWPTSDLRPPS